MIKILEQEVKAKPMEKIYKIFKLTTGNFSCNAGSWINFTGAQGSAQLEKGRMYKWDLIINGQYDAGNLAMSYRITLQNDNDKTSANLPNDIGAKKYITAGNWSYDFRDCDIFTVNSTGKYNFQLQVHDGGNNCNYQWNSNNGFASLFIEAL